jgi:tetratricopeptide (TPR) repeat protein
VGRIFQTNFDVLLTRLASGYRATVLESPAGDASADFELPYSRSELDDLTSALQLAAVAGRRVVPRQPTTTILQPPIDAARHIGGRLFDALFGGAVGTCFQRSLDQTSREGKRLRIRLRFGDTPELQDLPWEYLYDQQRESWLALSDRVSMVRYPAGVDPIGSLTISPPLRILIMIAQPSGAATLDVDAEKQMLNDALRELIASERVELDWCSPTLADLVPKLRQGPHVFHFIGHADFEPDGGGQLLLENADGRGQAMAGGDFGSLIVNHDTLRLVLLNACETGRSAIDDPFAGAAQRLVRMGVPAVIGMQFPVSDPAAIAFTSQFYDALSDGYPVDAALTEGRKGVLAARRGAEWGTPVLYVRASDTQLFSIAPLSEADRKARRVGGLDNEARAAEESERWDVAIGALESLVELDPSNAQAADRLRDARREQELAAQFAQARQDFDAGRWSEAIAYFGRVAELAGPLHPRYRGIFRFIVSAEAKLQPSVPSVGSAPIQASDPRLNECASALVRKITDGRVVIIVGDAVNRYGRPLGEQWSKDDLRYLPTGAELAVELARAVTPELPAGALVNVSQQYATIEGSEALRDELRNMLDADFEVTSMHRLLASLPGLLRDLGYQRYPVLVSTNYDDALERAFAEAGEPFDLVAYSLRDPTLPPHFEHRDPNGDIHPITPANTYSGVGVDRRTVLLKVYGALDRRDGDYVVAEDDYIDYAQAAEINALLPANLVTKLRYSHVFFLGYNPADWSLRVFFRRIWGEDQLSNYVAWAVGALASPLEGTFWRRRGVEVLETSLEAFAAAVLATLDGLKPAGARR